MTHKKIKFRGEINKLCKCGCGKEIIIKPHHKYYGILRYIHGHNKKGNVERDVIMGAIGLLGLVFLYGSAVLMIKTFGTSQIPFFFTQIQTLTLYHFGGIGLILVSDAYFLLTE